MQVSQAICEECRGIALYVPFKLDVIHGYNGGTAIKDMLRTKEISPRIISISSPEYNPGESILEVA